MSLLPRAGEGDCGGNAAPYVLGALTGAESEAFRVHLDSCVVCREEVAALKGVAAMLPATTPQFTAPRALKRRVMSEVRQEAKRQRVSDGGGEQLRPAAPRRWRPLIAPVGFGLALLALLAVLITGSGGGGGGSRVIRAQVSASGASALLRVSGGQAELTMSGMPQASAGRVYELWIKRAGGPERTDALFTVSSHGEASVGVPGGTAGVKTLMVTSEPLGGSNVPTTAPVVVANLG